MATVVYGDFEWDDAKAEANMRKHGVSFDEAATAFEDPNHLIVDDGSGDGETYWLVGFSIAGRLLTVVHVERGRRERIISARRATPEDERRYGHGRGEPTAPPKGTKAERRKALAEVARARLDALRSLGFVIPGDDGVALPPRGPRGGLWRPLEQYGLMYEGPARGSSDCRAMRFARLYFRRRGSRTRSTRPLRRSVSTTLARSSRSLGRYARTGPRGSRPVARGCRGAARKSMRRCASGTRSS
jgi:uncharacterized protein